MLSAPFSNPDGTVDKVIEAVIDVTERKKTEQMLRQSEQMFRSIVENSHAGIFVVDDAFRFTYANDRLCEILGYPQGEIIGRDFRDFVDEDSRQMVADRYVSRQKGAEVPSRYELGVVRKDGQKRRVELSSTVVTDSARKPGTIGQLLDVTERRRAVLSLMVRGLSNAEIGEHLVVSASTVKIHVSNILSKLGVSGRTEAVALALQHNLVS